MAKQNLKGVQFCIHDVESGKYFVRTQRGQDSPLSPGTTYAEVHRVPEGMLVIRQAVPMFYTKTMKDYRAAHQEANLLLAMDELELDADESKLGGDDAEFNVHM